ncbi:hypothetical protein QBC44DRAFT_314733 [Cladorrhinum sp. PSN332]|nr:hypothetical protein QBC44DRAFT_314733 [Cladorrhinum sp. PSN332]
MLLEQIISPSLFYGFVFICSVSFLSRERKVSWRVGRGAQDIRYGRKAIDAPSICLSLHISDYVLFFFHFLFLFLCDWSC